MNVPLSAQQVSILNTMRALGPHRVNQAVSAAEIAEVLCLQGTEDMRQLYASVHDDLKALAAAGLAEQCHTLHEWRLTDTGEAFFFKSLKKLIV